jgi:hypothetical protein
MRHDQIMAVMRENGKPVEYYVFPDEGHGFARPVNNMTFNAVTEEFLANYLGDDPKRRMPNKTSCSLTSSSSRHREASGTPS